MATNNVVEDVENFDIEGQYNASAKKRKSSDSIDVIPKQKLLKTMTQQREARKQVTDATHAELSDLRECVEADYEALKENEAKIQRMAVGVLMCMQQTTSAVKQKLQLIDNIKNKFKNQLEELEHNENLAITKMSEDLEDHINQLQAKIASDITSEQMAKMMKTIFQAMNYD